MVNGLYQEHEHSTALHRRGGKTLLQGFLDDETDDVYSF